MAGFPPKKAAKGRGKAVGKAQPDYSTTTTGSGGIAASLRKKNAGTKDSPGVEKNVNNP